MWEEYLFIDDEDKFKFFKDDLGIDPPEGYLNIESYEEFYNRCYHDLLNYSLQVMGWYDHECCCGIEVIELKKEKNDNQEK